MLQRYLWLVFLLLPLSGSAITLQSQQAKLAKHRYLSGNASVNIKPNNKTPAKINNFRIQIYKQYGHNRLGWIGVRYNRYQPYNITYIFSDSYLLKTIAKPGDRLLAINGISIRNVPLSISPDRLAGNIEQVTILHNGIVYDFPIVLIPLDSRYQAIYLNNPVFIP